MSRPDAHAHGFDNATYAGHPGRGHADQTGVGAHDYGDGGFSRDSIGRDFGGPELMSSNFYVPSPSVNTDRRSLTAGGFQGSGFPSYAAPRLLAPSQGLAAPSNSDTWNPKPATATNIVTKHTDASVTSQVQPSLPPFVHNHNHAHTPSPPRGPSISELYSSSLSATAATFNDRDPRDLYLSQRHLQQQPQSQPQSQPQPNSPAAQLQHQSPQSIPSPTTTSRSTLWWGELEPWMDEEYAKQVCTIMGWDPVGIKVPRPAPDPITGQQANNPGYCFLTFPSQTHAASVLSQISNNSGNPIVMPNSSKPFSLNWASSVPSASVPPTMPGQTITLPSGQNPQYPKEYSIFVGDLAPEVSNSDLVAVFRNPVLGLRNDREPRFIRPFLSCKSAKIMLDPVTGVSRGYGFVRFTDEADQQRALIEMHGLYCLSRPMRISPATAKFKPAPGMTGLDFSQMQFPLGPSAVSSMPEQQGQVTIALPLPNAAQAKSVSAPLAGASPGATNGGGNVSNSASNASSLGSGASVSSSSTLVSAPSEEAMKFVTTGNPSAPSVTAAFAQPTSEQSMAQRFNIPEESWKHHAQARAILSNLIGPNGEQLTSSDPYNTTVFVGGLSPLISEDTLRTFFAPFGDIHYVKVPVGKHCGFVQFVRKPDAERAIEKMQGFPIGGSRIRLSWGRSQYKAAQAAAQAAQAAAFQAQYQSQLTQQNGATMTPDQAMQLLERFGINNFIANGGGPSHGSGSETQPALYPDLNGPSRQALLSAFNPPLFGVRSEAVSVPTTTTGFSPFSPDPNYLAEGAKNQEPISPAHQQSFSNASNVSKGYPAWYNPSHDEKVTNGNGKISPTSALQTIRPPSASQRFNALLGEASPAASSFQATRSSSRQEATISRPDLSRKGSQAQEHFGNHEHEHDAIQDLNGTLASLDLNNSPGMWMSGENTNMLTSSSQP
ncbi:hypothetical protein DAEQUDRAFT_764783 [Daedalea quercina L-15889]|uniref:RRM domain-containing protein n=1 Tax=Daedalea quercina L-15889 TaxID=1314783 RepID=A0A165R5K1_9APHY|nr:hypothetical protein DAEQUDRAFT_764783 [Daedalea quercina L-15889]